MPFDDEDYKVLGIEPPSQYEEHRLTGEMTLNDTLFMDKSRMVRKLFLRFLGGLN